MSKITFRADDDLVDRLEAFDASKSEVMRRALRTYLESEAPVDGDDRSPGVNDGYTADTIDEMLRERVDDMIDERLDARFGTGPEPRDINVNVSLDGETTSVDEGTTADRKTSAPVSKTAVESASTPAETADDSPKSCAQCGENVGESHVYCPNCGEKATRRIFCECGDEIRSDWSFCPGCGRRTAAADVLDGS
ncbi:CopG family transcriptional regulator [Halobacteriales archaeon SW_7_68_16]|nr:MAG: CopG family transcriptional regulator [Halobacteriales archaeon SW_7_68_16]